MYPSHRASHPQPTATACALTLALCAGLVSHQARATEGGASIYLLGSGGPAAAVMPPFQGVYFDNTSYLYGGSSANLRREFVLGGQVVAGIDAALLGNFSTLLWVPTTDLMRATLGLGLTLPVGGPSIDVPAILSGPGGQQVRIAAESSRFTIGDPIITALLGWKSGQLHVQASSFVNIPIGDYHDGALANLAFHRWAADVSLAASWHPWDEGWDVTGKLGITFNGTNQATDYTSGTEFHLEGALERIFSRGFSAGVQAYYFNQLSGDGGPGAVLGPFEGEVYGLGVTAATHTTGRIPASLRVRLFQEFEAENRLEGTGAMLNVSFPLSMSLPP